MRCPGGRRACGLVRPGNDPRFGRDRLDAVDDLALSKDGGYIVPLKAKVRSMEGLDVGDIVTIRLTVADR